MRDPVVPVVQVAHRQADQARAVGQVPVRRQVAVAVVRAQAVQVRLPLADQVQAPRRVAAVPVVQPLPATHPAIPATTKVSGMQVKIQTAKAAGDQDRRASRRT